MARSQGNEIGAQTQKDSLIFRNQTKDTEEVRWAQHDDYWGSREKEDWEVLHSP